MEVKGITIHNTGNTLSARENYELAQTVYINLAHYLVDEKEVIELANIDEKVFHTGKGYDDGNLYTIAVEICRSRGDRSLYMKAQKRAVDLIKELMEKYSLTENDIYFHQDFNANVNCPHKILEIYKNKENFLKEVFFNDTSDE